MSRPNNSFASTHVPTLRAIPARADQRLRGLDHVAHAIAQCLDQSPRMTIQRAAATGSVSLFTHVAQRELHNPHADPALRDHRFGLALQVAIEQNYLGMAQAIHDIHAESLPLRSLRCALEKGTLEMVQWVITHRHDGLCCAAGIENLCRACLLGAIDILGDHELKRVLDWLEAEGLNPVFYAHEHNAYTELPSVFARLPTCLALVEWMRKKDYLSEYHVKTLVIDCLQRTHKAAYSIVQYVVGEYDFEWSTDEVLVMALTHAACIKGHEHVVDTFLNSPIGANTRARCRFERTRPDGPRILQWDATLPTTHLNYVVRAVAERCHLDTLEWLVAERGVTQVKAHWSWKHAAEPTAIAFCEYLLDTGIGQWSIVSVEAASSEGYDALAAWFVEHDITGEPGTAWRPVTSPRPRVLTDSTSARMANVAAQGDLETLVQMHTDAFDACTFCVRQQILHATDRHANVTMWSVRSTLEWLDAHATRAIGCVGRCVNPTGVLYRGESLAEAPAGRGDIQLQTYVRGHHPELFPRRGDRCGAYDQILVLRGVVEGGHIPELEQLYGYYHDVFDWSWKGRKGSTTGDDVQRVRDWAEDGRWDEVRAWLDEHM